MPAKLPLCWSTSFVRKLVGGLHENEVFKGVEIPFRGLGFFRLDGFATFNERHACSLFLFLRHCVSGEAYADFPWFAVGSSFVSCDFLNISHCGDCLQHINKVHGLTQEDQN
jgi:hypothetical protein